MCKKPSSVGSLFVSRFSFGAPLILVRETEIRLLCTNVNLFSTMPRFGPWLYHLCIPPWKCSFPLHLVLFLKQCCLNQFVVGFFVFFLMLGTWSCSSILLSYRISTIFAEALQGLWCCARLYVSNAFSNMKRNGALEVFVKGKLEMFILEIAVSLALGKMMVQSQFETKAASCLLSL